MYFGPATALGRIAAPWRLDEWPAAWRSGDAQDAPSRTTYTNVAAYLHPRTRPRASLLPHRFAPLLSLSLVLTPPPQTNPLQTTSSSTSTQPHTSRSAGTPPRSTTPWPSSRSPRSLPRILAKDGDFGGARAALAHYSSSSSSSHSSSGEKANEKDELLSEVADAEAAAAQLWTACGKSATRALRVATHSVSLRVECALGAGT
ncbi:hypothetical protein B0H17DRAFT_1220835 [Mycena rosella]|uniref:Uncharacterized protein n=1 Tax=Mycena rosella TaxID=1033263 RepID=A0AAD7B834_MYCRO|nr:hypothetical protein B0H17DRAFT_1220835 [Mycena rosella]